MRRSERKIIRQVPSASAIARQIYLCILRALEADRRNAARLKRPRFSRFSLHARELSTIRQISLSKSFPEIIHDKTIWKNDLRTNKTIAKLL